MNPITDTGATSYTNEVVRVARSMTTNLSRLLKLLADAPEDVLNSRCFQIAADACNHLFSVRPRVGAHQAESGSQGDGPRLTQSQAAECDDWSRPEWDEWLAEMLDVWERRNNMNVQAPPDFPSFSIGLTQTFGRVSLTPPHETAGTAEGAGNVPDTVATDPIIGCDRAESPDDNVDDEDLDRLIDSGSMSWKTPG